MSSQLTQTDLFHCCIFYAFSTLFPVLVSCNNNTVWIQSKGVLCFPLIYKGLPTHRKLATFTSFLSFVIQYTTKPKKYSLR